jgi:hypothetical protein
LNARSPIPFDYQQKLLALLIALTFVGYPLYSYVSVALKLSEFDSRSITVPYRVGVLALSVFLFGTAYFRRELLFGSRTHNLFFVLWLMYLARLVFDTTFRELPLSRPAWEFWAFAVGVSLFSFTGMMRRISEGALRLAAWLIWIFAFGACLLGLITQSTQTVLSEERVSGNQILNPISFGQTAVTLILMSGYLVLQVRRTSAVVGLLAATIPAFYIVAVAGSRSPLVSLAIGIVVLTAYGIKRGVGWRLSLGALLPTVLLPIGFQYLFSAGSILTTRLFETVDAYKVGELDRFVIWDVTLSEYVRSPFVGAGIELSIGAHPHNLILEAFLAMGFIGGALFCWLMVESTRAGFRLLSSTEAGWLPLIFMQFFTLSLFSGNLWSSMELWAIVLVQAGATMSSTTRRAIGRSHYLAEGNRPKSVAVRA